MAPLAAKSSWFTTASRCPCCERFDPREESDNYDAVTTMEPTMQEMMDATIGGGMMWGMELFWLLLVVILVLGAAALIKYLFPSDKRK